MTHPRFHRNVQQSRQAIIDHLGGDTERSVLIVGNGPSAAIPRHDLLPDDPLVFRMNWFFLEDRYYYGRRVDGFFYSVSQPLLEQQLVDIIDDGTYDIAAVFSPMQIPVGRNGERYRSEVFETGVPEYDHWTAIADEPELARFMMSRPLPTQGMQVLGFALDLGFRDVTLCGIDMYESNASRYGYVIPDAVAASLDPKDLRPGYEVMHSLDRDLAFLDACLRLYPSANVRHVGPSRYLASRLPEPDQRERPCTFDGVSAREIARCGKQTLSSLTDDAVSVRTDDLPSKTIDGRECGYVTLVSGPFHHGARALARSLAQVSDVPLTVMCTPSADRAKLRASGLACIDIPEVLNPNELRGHTERFATTYSKLNAFRMTHLDRAVYVDADMIVLRSIDDLFDHEGFWAVPDHGIEHHYDRFNSGLFRFDPSVRTFERLVDAIADTSSYDGGDQGFLNEMFPEWNSLDHSYNVNKRWSSDHPNLFDIGAARVIHFVGIKPWQYEGPSAYDALYQRWYSFLDRDELAELARELRSGPPPAPAPRRSTIRTALEPFRRGASPGQDRSDWSSGSLIRRVQARTAAGAYEDALDLLGSEWPGDERAGAGLLRERAKALMLTGRVSEGLAALKEAAELHPDNRAIQKNLAALRRVDQLVTGTRGHAPEALIAAGLRIADRRSTS